MTPSRAFVTTITMNTITAAGLPTVAVSPLTTAGPAEAPAQLLHYCSPCLLLLFGTSGTAQQATAEPIVCTRLDLLPRSPPHDVGQQQHSVLWVSIL